MPASANHVEFCVNKHRGSGKTVSGFKERKMQDQVCVQQVAFGRALEQSFPIDAHDSQVEQEAVWWSTALHSYFNKTE